jgi:hypothetical protein
MGHMIVLATGNLANLTHGPSLTELYRLAECDFDVYDLILGESLLAAHGRDLSVVAEESPGHHAHPKEEGTGFPSSFGKADGINACPL